MTPLDDVALSMLRTFQESMTMGGMPPILSIFPHGQHPPQHLLGGPEGWVAGLRAVLEKHPRIDVLVGGVDGSGQRVDPALLEAAASSNLPDVAAVFVATADAWSVAVIPYDRVGGEVLWGEPYLPTVTAGSLPDLIHTLRQLAWKEDDQ